MNLLMARYGMPLGADIAHSVRGAGSRWSMDRQAEVARYPLQGGVAHFDRCCRASFSNGCAVEHGPARIAPSSVSLMCGAR